MAFVGGGERGIASFFRQLCRLRVREVPEFLRKTVTRESIQSNGEKYLEEYREKYIKTGSILPVYHAMAGVFATAYVVTWPTEYRHVKAAQEGGGH